MENKEIMIHVREFDMKNDLTRAEDLEKKCEVGPSGTLSFFTDLMGDPLCRIRHSPVYIMLVAEYGTEREMVGIIRSSIKNVVCDTNDEGLPIYAKTAYVLGLRVSPFHRRRGVGLRLVEEIEKWARDNGAEYIYMATEKDNEACINLFVKKQGYAKFRTPSILAQPVHSHKKTISRKVQITKLSNEEAMKMYAKTMGDSEFFPSDMESVLSNEHSLGAFRAVIKDDKDTTKESWAVMSVWKTSEMFRMKVCGVSKATRMYASMTRIVDKAMPWLKVPSIPDVFGSYFGVYFVYGFHAQGSLSDVKCLSKDLWKYVHNLAKDDKKRSHVKVIATEVGCLDPLKSHIPFWNSFSCEEDLWCIKKLSTQAFNWTLSQPPHNAKLFVDPRDF